MFDVAFFWTILITLIILLVLSVAGTFISIFLLISDDDKLTNAFQLVLCIVGIFFSLYFILLTYAKLDSL